MLLVVKNLPASGGDAGDASLISQSGRSPGVGNGNMLQYSCLENSRDRLFSWAIVHGVAKNQTRLNTHTHTHTHTHTRTYLWASQVAQLVKNPPAVQETLVRFLNWEDPLENK